MPIEFTQAELVAILGGVDMPPGVYDIDELIRRIAEQIDLDGLTESMIAVGGAASPEALAAATELARRQARQIAANLTAAELSSIAEKVRENIAEGKNYQALYNKLSEIKGLDKNRAATLEKYRQSLIDQGVEGKALQDKVQAMHDKLLRDRKKTIARTEQAMATSDGQRSIATQRGAKFHRWITSKDDRVSDMDEENEAVGWIPFDEPFPSGDMAPPSHPNCRCTVAYRTTEPSDADKRRAAESAAKTTEAKRDE